MIVFTGEFVTLTATRRKAHARITVVRRMRCFFLVGDARNMPWHKLTPPHTLLP